MSSGRRWGLICLGAACWDKLLDLLQGQVLAKVRVSDQPDVVSSFTEWFVSLNACFPLLCPFRNSKTTSWLSAPRQIHRSQSCCWCVVGGSLECAAPAICHIPGTMWAGLCKWACVCFKSCRCPTNSLPRDMGSGNHCCQILGP